MLSDRILSILGAILLVGTGATIPLPAQAQPFQVTQTAWQPFTSQVGGFTVSLPGTPKQEVDRGKPGETDSYSFVLDKGDTAYFVSYYDLPGSLSASKTRDFFNRVRDEAIRDSKSRLVLDDDITLNRFPGKSIKYTDKDGVTYYCRMYLVNQRLYLTLMAIAKGQDEQFTLDARRFLDSFRLI